MTLFSSALTVFLFTTLNPAQAATASCPDAVLVREKLLQAAAEALKGPSEGPRQTVALAGDASNEISRFLIAQPQGQTILVVKDAQADASLDRLIAWSQKLKGRPPSEILKSVTAYLDRHGIRPGFSRRWHPFRYKRYTALISQESVFLGDFLQTGIFDLRASMAYSLLSHVACTAAGMPTALKIGSLVTSGEGITGGYLGGWINRFNWIETPLTTPTVLASLADGVSPLNYFEGTTRWVNITTFRQSILGSINGILSELIQFPVGGASAWHRNLTPATQAQEPGVDATGTALGVVF
ncbi:hypothetical protein K2X33_10210 [bacterium]|nr:hypothetical protein [bacterium]